MLHPTKNLALDNNDRLPLIKGSHEEPLKEDHRIYQVTIEAANETLLSVMEETFVQDLDAHFHSKYRCVCMQYSCQHFRKGAFSRCPCLHRRCSLPHS